jgi:hypothetical protein
MKYIFVTKTGSRYVVNSITKTVYREGGKVYYPRTNTYETRNDEVGKLDGRITDYFLGDRLLVDCDGKGYIKSSPIVSVRLA